MSGSRLGTGSNRRTLLVLAALGVAAACAGPAGPAGPRGDTGGDCTITANADGTKTITCGADTFTTTNADGSCTIAANTNGTKTITCADGTTVTVNDGPVVLPAPADVFPFKLAAELPATLVATVTSVEIAGKPVVKFKVTDGAGRGASGLAGGATGQVRISLAKLVAGENGASDSWKSYVNRLGGTAPSQVTQATSDRGPLVDNLDGTYTYTFATDVTAAKDPLTQAAIAYEPNVTHRLVIQISGKVGPNTLPAINSIFDFVPAGGTPTKLREIVSETSCNECHGTLVAHGSRYDTDYCVVCHNPGTKEAAAPQKSADFGPMVHGIHSAGFRKAAAAPAFTFANQDFSEVTYPQDLRNCRKCHDGADAATPQGDNWKNKPSIEACGGCHAKVDFATHSGGQTDSSKCQLCHAPDKIEQQHLTENATTHNPAVPAGAYVFKYEIKEVTVNASNQAVVTFRILRNGAPMNFTTDLADLTGAPGFLVAYAKPQDGIDAPGEYNNLGRAAGQPATVSISTLVNGTQGTLTAPDGEGFVTATLAGTTAAPAAFPAGSTLRAVALQGYFTQKDFPVAGQSLARHTISVVKPVTGDPVRRQIVDSAKCGSCHEWFEGHGGNRVFETAVCVTCHVPNLTSSGRGADPASIPTKMTAAEQAALTAHGYDPLNPLTYPEAPNGFKELIHGIHGGEMRSHDMEFVRDRGSSGVFYYDFAEVTFPGDPARCETCHKPGTYAITLPPNALASNTRTQGPADTRSSILAARTSVPNLTDLVTTPAASACFSCHDSPVAKGHMEQMGAHIKAPRSELNTADETCALCHGPGRVADVALVHAR